MKKSFGILILATFLLTLTGCGNKANEGNLEGNKQVDIEVNDCKKGCDMFTSETVSKEDCYGLCETSKKLESNDISDCDNIEETSNKFITKDVCIQDKAIQSKNAEYCSMISTEASQDSCYAWLASQTKDKKICENINNETIKSICLTDETGTEE